MQRGVSIMLVALLACVSCGAEGPDAPGAPPGVPIADSYPEKSVVHWAPLRLWNDELIGEAALSRSIVIPMEQCFSEETRPVLERLRELNPDLRVIAYLPLLCVYTVPPDTTGLRGVVPFLYDYYETVRENWAVTTTGDTLMIWPEAIFLDPISNGGIDRDLIEKIADLLEGYQQSGYPPIDGIMHDYFMYCVYVNPACRPGVEGEPDLDGDGIPCAEDGDERDLLLLWQKEYMRELRSRFGEDFIMIGNGRPPQENAELAGLLNGIFYEAFPNGPWGWTDREGFMRLIENQREGYLAPTEGRTWSILSNDRIEYNNLFCLVSSLLAGCLYTELHGSCIFTGWTLDVNAGAPAGELSLDGSPDSLLTAFRLYSRGEARISFGSNGGRREVTFETGR